MFGTLGRRRCVRPRQPAAEGHSRSRYILDDCDVRVLVTTARAPRAAARGARRLHGARARVVLVAARQWGRAGTTSLQRRPSCLTTVSWTSTWRRSSTPPAAPGCRRASCCRTATCSPAPRASARTSGTTQDDVHPRRAPSVLRRRPQPGHDRLPRRRPRRAPELPPAAATSCTLCAKHGVTGLTCVPPLWIQLADLPWPAEATRTLRYFANTGGRMPRATLDRLRALFPSAKPFLMYGLTEAFRSTYLDPAEVDRRPDSIGKAIPGAEILVVREDGSRCDPGEHGELVHRGALVSLGYWNDPVRTAERFRPAPGRDGALCTPEIGGVLGRRGRRRRGRVPLLREPQGRDDQDVGLSRQPDRDRGGRVRHGPRRATPSPSASRIRAIGQVIALVVSPAGDEDVDPDALRGVLAKQLPRLHGPAPGRPSAARSRARRTASSTARCCAASSRHERLHDTRRPRLSRRRRHRPRARSPRAPGRRRSSRTTAAPITERVALLRATLPADVKLSYAIKANPMPAVVQHLSGLVDAFDTASAGELRIALDTPTPAERVSFAGPGKTPAELTQAVAAGGTHRARVGDRGAARHRDRRVVSAAVRASRSA